MTAPPPDPPAPLPDVLRRVVDVLRLAAGFFAFDRPADAVVFRAGFFAGFLAGFFAGFWAVDRPEDRVDFLVVWDERPRDLVVVATSWTLPSVGLHVVWHVVWRLVWPLAMQPVWRLRRAPNHRVSGPVPQRMVTERTPL